MRKYLVLTAFLVAGVAVAPAVSTNCHDQYAAFYQRYFAPRKATSKTHVHHSAKTLAEWKAWREQHLAKLLTTCDEVETAYNSLTPRTEVQDAMDLVSGDAELQDSGRPEVADKPEPMNPKFLGTPSEPSDSGNTGSSSSSSNTGFRNFPTVPSGYLFPVSTKNPASPPVDSPGVPTTTTTTPTAATPEPYSLTLLGTGLIGLARLLHKRER